jgi:hypothetical protein
MKEKRMQHSPLWELNYRYPGLDKRVTKLCKSFKELNCLLCDRLGKEKKQKKK